VRCRARRHLLGVSEQYGIFYLMVPYETIDEPPGLPGGDQQQALLWRAGFT
jgi:hypothetical protein